MKKLIFIICLFALIGLVYASPYLVDENMNFLGNDIYNATNINGTYLYQNGSIVLTTEVDPYWTANQSSYSTTAEIIVFGYYNASDFVITDYFTKSDITGFGYYNSSDFSISDYFTSSQILAFNYYNSSDFSISDYFTSAQVLGFAYYNSTDFSISDYYTQTQIDNFNYYNSSDFSISNYYTITQIDNFGYYNSSDFNINDYRLDNWDNFTGIPTATPSDGDTTHLSTANHIYDWVIGLGYSTTTGTVTSVATDNTYLTGGAITTTGTITFNETKMNQTVNNIAVAVNTTMKAYVDGQDVTFNNSLKVYTDAQDIVFNNSIKAYADGTFAILGYGDSWNKTYADTLYADISVVDTNTLYTAGIGLTLSSEEFSHADTSSQANSTNAARTYVNDILFDTFGHVTSVVTGSETVVDTNANTICSGTTTYLDGEGNCDDISSVYAPLNYGDEWNKTYADTLYADISVVTDNVSWNQSFADTRYRFESWDNFTGIPTASPSNGDVTHFSLADQIYDWVIGLGYTTLTLVEASLGNWSLDKSDYWNSSTDIDTVLGDDEITEGKIAFSTACSAGNYYRLNGNDLECTTPTDTTYTAGDYLYLSTTEFNVNSTELNATIDARDADTTYSAGNGISLSTTTFSVAGNTALTQDVDGLSVTNDGIGDTQLAFNTGQHLTTTSDVKFDDINMTGNLTIQTGFGTCYNADCSSYKMFNGTCEITVIGTTTLNICP